MTSMDEAVHELVEQLTKRKRYLQEIRTLAQRQKMAIARKNQEELLQLLEERKQIISQVNALDAADNRALEFFRSGGKSLQRAAPDGPPEEVLAVARDIKSIASEILSLDEENIASARHLQNDLRMHLDGINKHRRSKKLYQGDGKKITGALINKTR